MRRNVCFSAVRDLLLASLSLATAAAAQDLTVVSQVTVGNSVANSTEYMTAERSRTTDGQSDVLIHYPTGTMTMIEHKKKQYYETTVEEMSAYFDRLARNLKGSPMEKMFGLEEEAKVEKLPGERKIAGYDCEHYSLSVGDALELDLWAAPSLAPPPRYFDGRKLSYAAMGPMGKLFETAFDGLKKVRGFPLSTTFILRTPMSRTQTTSEATEVRKGPIPASTFEIPAGYKKTKSPFAK